MPTFSFNIENKAIKKLEALGEATFVLCPATENKPAHIKIESIKKPNNQDIAFVNDALEESVFRYSVEKGFEGRVIVDAPKEMLADYYRNGFVTGEEKIDLELARLAVIPGTDKVDLSCLTIPLGNQRMYLPPKNIQVKLREFRYKDKYSVNHPAEVQYLYVQSDHAELLKHSGYIAAIDLAKFLYVSNAARNPMLPPAFKKFDTYAAALAHANAEKQGTIIKVNAPLENQGELFIDRAYKGTLSRTGNIESEMNCYAHHIAWFEPYTESRNKQRGVNPYYACHSFEEEKHWNDIVNAARALVTIGEKYLTDHPKPQTSIFSTDQVSQTQALSFVTAAKTFLQTLEETTDIDQHRMPYAKFIRDVVALYATLPKRDDLKIEFDKLVLPSFRKSVSTVVNSEKGEIAAMSDQVDFQLDIDGKKSNLFNLQA
jgi:uncharacterized protein (DUF3820 family)